MRREPDAARPLRFLLILSCFLDPRHVSAREHASVPSVRTFSRSRLVHMYAPGSAFSYSLFFFFSYDLLSLLYIGLFLVGRLSSPRLYCLLVSPGFLAPYRVFLSLSRCVCFISRVVFASCRVCINNLISSSDCFRLASCHVCVWVKNRYDLLPICIRPAV